MKPIRIDLFGQSGQHETSSLAPGWTPLWAIKAGVWVFETSLSFWNACPGAGELYLSRIEITFNEPIPTGAILPCSNWHIDPMRPNVLIIGNGHEHIAPRAQLTVRWAYPTRCPSSAQYGPVKLAFAPSQRTEIFTALKAALVAPRPTGMLAPFGPPQPDTQGGGMVGSFAGWEQDAPGFLLRHDLNMQRMAIGRLNQSTGQPIRTVSPEYDTVRGYGKTTQLPEFCQPASPNTDVRYALVTWPGTCPYRDQMMGVERSNWFGPYDAQHLERVLITAKAAVQCGDAGARFDLDMIAADCQIARMDTSTMPNGSRQQGWTIDALLHSRFTFAIARHLIDQQCDAQTESGAVLRAPFGYPFAPGPWSVSETIQNPMPTYMDADTTLERSICCHSAALDNRVDFVRRALAGMPHPAPHYVGVGERQTVIYPTYQHPCGYATWELWMALGAAAALDHTGTWWHYYVLNNATPGGKRAHSLLELRDILRAEKVGMDQTAVLRCTLEGMQL